MDFSKAEEKDGDSELVFDGPELDDALADLLADTPARPLPAPTSADQDQALADLMDFIPMDSPAPAPKPARATPKPAAAMLADVDLSEMLGGITPAATPAPPPEPAPAPADQSVDDAAPDAAPPPAPAAPVAGRLARLALPLAALAATLSSVGVVVTARNLSTLAAQQAVLDKRTETLAAVPALVEELKKVNAQTRAELRMTALRRPADAATKADLDGALDALRNALSRMQAPGTAALAGVVRAGQTELSGEISKLHDRIDSIEDRRGGAAH